MKLQLTSFILDAETYTFVSMSSSDSGEVEEGLHCQDPGGSLWCDWHTIHPTVCDVSPSLCSVFPGVGGSTAFNCDVVSMNPTRPQVLWRSPCTVMVRQNCHRFFSVGCHGHWALLCWLPQGGQAVALTNGLDFLAWIGMKAPMCSMLAGGND